MKNLSKQHKDLKREEDLTVTGRYITEREKIMKKLIKHIIETGKKHSLKNDIIFNTFIDMTYQLNCTTTYHIDYKYLEKEHFIFKTMLGDLIDQNPFTDVLGEVMLEVFNFDKKYLGQCMTPNDISSLISKICYRKQLESKGYKNEEPLNVGDDTGCGTGSILLANLKMALTSNAKTINIFANDIDEKIVKICIVQLQYNRVIYYANNRQNHKKINLIAYCGNTLTGYEKPENIRCHPELRRINEPYVKGYFKAIDRANSLNVFNSITDRFKQKPLKNKKVA